MLMEKLTLGVLRSMALICHFKQHNNQLFIWIVKMTKIHLHMSDETSLTSEQNETEQKWTQHKWTQQLNIFKQLNRQKHDDLVTHQIIISNVCLMRERICSSFKSTSRFVFNCNVLYWNCTCLGIFNDNKNILFIIIVTSEFWILNFEYKFQVWVEISR